MRWRPPSERVQMMVALPIVGPICLVALPFILCIAAGYWLLEKVFPPRSWHPWFAWRPVRLDQRPTEWAWLETVERETDWRTRSRYKRLGDNRRVRDSALSQDNRL